MERIYTINLKKQVSKVSRERKANKAIRVIKDFLKDHMKTDTVKIGKSITEKIWEGGNQNPPTKIRIKATKEEDVVKAELWESVAKKEPEKPKEKPKK